MQKNLYNTTDIYLAATLKVLNVHLDGFHKKGKGRTSFVFQKTNKCQDIARGYYEDAVTVAPKKLRDALRELKTMVIQGEKKPEAI